ncbi:MAG: zinc ribbon domain-containing protein [Candidatus Sumerlaeaceae bacterium]|nr:zinc ribbon domain-containing protein [Candidatus Sumerlaeaceae bacterium]
MMEEQGQIERYDTTRCPKCGQASKNNEVCDFCGAVFAKVREREYAQESFSLRTTHEEQPSQGSLGRVIFLVAIFVVIVGAIAAGFWIWHTTTPKTVDDLIAAHRSVTKRARQVIADEIEAQKSLPEHNKIYIEILDLASAVSKMSERKDLSEEARQQLDFLNEANSRLAELMMMSVEEFVASAAKKNYADPFAEVDEKLNYAQNPELAKKATNPLIQVFDVLKFRATQGRQ